MCCLKKSILIVLCLFSFSITGVAAAKPPVNMQVSNAEVRDVLTALASVGKVNMILDDSVKGTITIQLTNIPYDSAFDLVCKTKGLTYQLVGDVMVVGVAEQIGRAFGSVHTFKLKFINPDSVKDTILSILFGAKKGQKITQTEGSSAMKTANTQQSSAAATTGEKSSEESTALDRLTIDYATNSLILFGTNTEAARVQKLLDELDVPYQQVSLEAEVLAISKEKTKNIGIEWSWEATPQYAERDKDDDDNIMVTRENNKGIIQFGRNPEGYPYEFYYQATINALVSNGDAKVLARPKVTTINGQQAQILIGDRIPVQVQTLTNGTTTTSTEYIDAGIKLIYTPRINTDGLITVQVLTEVSSPTLVSDIKQYKITTRQAETTVRLKDGETMVIGGLIGSTDSEARKAVPFFSGLPIIGALFKNFSKTHNDTEVVIFLTPRIVK
jgi:type IV pilus assembly protein PilQ